MAATAVETPTNECGGCATTMTKADILRKAPASRRFKDLQKDLLKFSEEESERCAKKRARREEIRNERLRSGGLSDNDDHFLRKTEALLDSIDGCTAIERLNKLEKEAARRPSLDSLARYDIVYIFIQDLKRLTRKKHIRIEDIDDPTFIRRYPQSEQLLRTVESSFATTENGLPVSGVKNFLSITQDIAMEHANTAHLTAEEKAQYFNYDRLLGLCDPDEAKVLDIVRSFSADPNWPLLRNYN